MALTFICADVLDPNCVVLWFQCSIGFPSQSCINLTISSVLIHQGYCFFINQPPTVLRSNDAQTEQETVEISVTRLLLKSYYDIVSKNIQDSVPKAIMHFLVSQHTQLGELDDMASGAFWLM